MNTLRCETLDTTAVPPADRFPLWVEMAGHASAPTTMTSENAHDFRGHARLVTVGSIQLSRFRYQSLTCRRTPTLIRRGDPEIYQMALTLAGDSAISARRRDTVVPVGDFTFIDWGRPHDIQHATERHGRAPSAVTVSIPRALLPLDPDRVDRLTAARLPGTTGPGALLAQHLHHLTRHPEQFPEATGPQLADIVLSLVCMMIATQLDATDQLPGEIRQQALTVRIRDFVDRNLPDPDLNPQAVADAHHISVRTLHRLFAAGDETVAGLIRQRRLHRCRRDLADPSLRHQPVHRIARRWGFTDPAHFSRVFRAAHGMGPQAYRALHTGPAMARTDNPVASTVKAAAAD